MYTNFRACGREGGILSCTEPREKKKKTYSSQHERGHGESKQPSLEISENCFFYSKVLNQVELHLALQGSRGCTVKVLLG